MAIMSCFPGMGIPLPYWIFGFCAPLFISTPVCLLLARQAEQKRQLAKTLHAAMEELRRLAEIDQMTGLLNRASFLSRLEKARLATPGLCLLIDVDHFKAINDRAGHAAGDQALKSIAESLRHAVRDEDLCGRLGGEEFAVYLSGVPEALGATMAERIRETVEALVIRAEHGPVIRPTISVGCAHARDSLSAEQMLRRADLAMYAAKAAGRNQVRLAA
ncbi:diguanylate cyclase (GGDEF)-like protein [Sphingobium sp. OAS761]|nr:diguanylate cyclase (GGDEF)-like protein [Sphingobium sp. OAS761]